MFRKALLSGVAIASASIIQPAGAADLPSRKAPAVYEPAPIFTWTGFHIGITHGFGGGPLDADVGMASSFFGFGALTHTGNRASGFFVGADAGYDYQFGNNVVLGVETDGQWSDIRASHQAATGAGALPFFGYANIQNKLEWFGTARARLGYAFGRLLPYVTGGVAYGENRASGVQIVNNSLTYGSADHVRVGWAAGAGLDYAVTDQLSARVEYLYLELPGVSGPVAAITPFGPFVGTFTTGSYGAHLIRGGFNWRFDSQGKPLPAGLIDALLNPGPALNWTGVYVGANGGYGGDVTSAQINLASPILWSSTQTNNHSGGFIAGGQIGYNYQFANNIVLGVESDMQWSDVKAWHQASTFSPVGFAFTDVKHELAWFGTTRVRAGYAMGRVLTYLTGGVAYGELNVQGDQNSGGLFTGSVSTTKAGWAAGLGAEYALTDNISLKSEYLYTEFSGVRAPAFGQAILPVIGEFSTSSFRTHITRVGLNWRFSGFGAAPVVAKY
jgi:opacity protein-like surface antigen